MTTTAQDRDQDADLLKVIAKAAVRCKIRGHRMAIYAGGFGNPDDAGRRRLARAEELGLVRPDGAGGPMADLLPPAYERIEPEPFGPEDAWRAEYDRGGPLKRLAVVRVEHELERDRLTPGQVKWLIEAGRPGGDLAGLRWSLVRSDAFLRGGYDARRDRLDYRLGEAPALAAQPGRIPGEAEACATTPGLEAAARDHILDRAVEETLRTTDGLPWVLQQLGLLLGADAVAASQALYHRAAFEPERPDRTWNQMIGISLERIDAKLADLQARRRVLCGLTDRIRDHGGWEAFEASARRVIRAELERQEKEGGDGR
jgi:hypothetical protein